MTRADDFWRHAVRSAYLTSIERAGLRDLLPRCCILTHQRGIPCRCDCHDQEPIMLNYGYGERPFTMAAALRWAERLAREELR